MKVEILAEPELEFGTGKHIDIRFGLMQHGPLDYSTASAPKRIRVGVVGNNQTIEGVCRWLERCRKEIPAKPSKQPYLFPRFPGFHLRDDFQSELVLDSNAQRSISQTALLEVTRLQHKDEIVREGVELFLAELRYLADNTNADVLICAMPIELIEAIEGSKPDSEDEGDEQGEGANLIFHDMLKAEAMSLRRPLQVIRPATYDEKMRRRQKQNTSRFQSLQDEATRAWNIHTALYYKAGGVPWRLIRDPSLLSACFIGISFYTTLDRSSVMTSMAQVFNQRGEGVIVRGGAAQVSKEDRQPHLGREDAFKLLKNSLDRYREEHKTLPARVVLHKTSSFDRDELEGFRDAVLDREIDYYDFLSISDSDTRLLRYGVYAPLRGTLLTLSGREQVLYTKASVDFFQAYPGMYVPMPRLIRCEEVSEAPAALAMEILALTKMNWNNTQFDGSLPITLRAAKQVGSLLKYIPEGTPVEAQYRYYM